MHDAVAAAILYQRAEPYYPIVYERLQSAKKDTRMALIYPLVDLANEGDAQAIYYLNAVIQHDPDNEVRQFAAETREALKK